MVGVFAAPAPFIGGLVSLRVLCSVAAASVAEKVCDSLRILSGIADHFGRPSAPRSPLCGIMVPPGMEVFVCTYVIGFSHVRVGSPHVFSPLTSFLEEREPSLAADAQDQGAQQDAHEKLHPAAE